MQKVFKEEIFLLLAGCLKKLHILNTAVHHGAAVSRYQAVREIEAALDSSLQQRPARLAQKARHIICSDVE